MITIITNTAHNKIGVLAERNPDSVISFSSQFQNGQGTDNRTVPFSCKPCLLFAKEVKSKY